MLFSTATLTFLRGLKRHNDRAWFEAHRPEFEAAVQQPLRALPDGIARDPKRFTKIATDRRVLRRFGGLSEEAVLRRVPRGFAPDHPAARWLKFQSFVMGRALTDAQVVSARLGALLEADFRLMQPLVRWIHGVLGLRAAERR